MIVLLNPAAHGGRAAAKWRRVRPALERRSALTVRTPATLAELDRAIDAALRSSAQMIVAAGGDGRPGGAPTVIPARARRVRRR